MILNKTIAFVCGINEVNEKTTKFSEVLRKMSAGNWEVAPATVTPVAVVTSSDGNVATSKVMVSISYSWSWEFPMPQEFEKYFGESKKESRKEYIEEMCSTWGK